jgi:hypothetical protein
MHMLNANANIAKFKYGDICASRCNLVNFFPDLYTRLVSRNIYLCHVGYDLNIAVGKHGVLNRFSPNLQAMDSLRSEVNLHMNLDYNITFSSFV